MLRRFVLTTRGSLLEAMFGIILLGALSYAFWFSWNGTMNRAGEGLKAKIESESWLN